MTKKETLEAKAAEAEALKAIAKAEEKAKEPAKKAQPAKKEKAKPAAYTRIDATCAVLKQSKTIADLIKNSDDAYVKAGGSSNLRESKTVTHFCLNVLKHFDSIQIPKE